MLGLNVARAEVAGFATRKEDHPTRFLVVPFKHLTVLLWRMSIYPEAADVNFTRFGSRYSGLTAIKQLGVGPVGVPVSSSPILPYTESSPRKATESGGDLSKGRLTVTGQLPRLGTPPTP